MPYSRISIFSGSNSAHIIPPLQRARSLLFVPPSNPKKTTKSCALVKGTAMFTSMHLVIYQRGVNYYHASWHYHATFCFILFSLQSGARTDVVRARSDTNPGLLPQLPLLFLVISGLSGSLFYQLFICTWKLCNIHFHAASFYTWKCWRQDLRCALLAMCTA